MSRRLLVVTTLALPVLAGCALFDKQLSPVAQEDYLVDVGMAGVGYPVWGEEEVLEAGYAVCDGYRDGYRIFESADALSLSQGIDFGDALVLATAAAQHLCPDAHAEFE
ncbi:DUF732 domain-containing protein [Geodermatophilus amargosae]|uniref:DUF732 domain-containing protein n=1 Tax=Geodermatophilus amargosae TaxID=1296565 RepID=UPI0034DF3037